MIEEVGFAAARELRKWLQNRSSFARYNEFPVRQTIRARSKLVRS